MGILSNVKQNVEQKRLREKTLRRRTNVQNVLKKRKITLTEFAKIVGISQPHASRYFGSKANQEIEEGFARRIEHCLDLPAEYLDHVAENGEAELKALDAGPDPLENLRHVYNTLISCTNNAENMEEFADASMRLNRLNEEVTSLLRQMQNEGAKSRDIALMRILGAANPRFSREDFIKDDDLDPYAFLYPHFGETFWKSARNADSMSQSAMVINQWFVKRNDYESGLSNFNLNDAKCKYTFAPKMPDAIPYLQMGSEGRVSFDIELLAFFLLDEDKTCSSFLLDEKIVNEAASIIAKEDNRKTVEIIQTFNNRFLIEGIEISSFKDELDLKKARSLNNNFSEINQ